MMKIAICGSMEFYDEMLEIKSWLETIETTPHQAEVPDKEELEANSKTEFIHRHFKKIKQSDAILVANYTKRGIENYIGSNTLIEMGVASYLGKPIYLLNPIPEMDSRDEIEAMTPIILNGELSKIK